MIGLYDPQAKSYFSCQLTLYFSSHPSQGEDEVLGFKALKVSTVEQYYMPDTAFSVWREESFHLHSSAMTQVLPSLPLYRG